MCLLSPKSVHSEQLLWSLDWPCLPHRVRAQSRDFCCLSLYLEHPAQSSPLVNVCGMDVRRKEGSKLPAALLATAVSIMCHCSSHISGITFSVNFFLGNCEFLGLTHSCVWHPIYLYGKSPKEATPGHKACCIAMCLMVHP